MTLLEAAKAVVDNNDAGPHPASYYDVVPKVRMNALRAAIEAAESDPYAKFGRLVVDNIANQPHWWADEWSAEIMPLAVDAGLAEYVPYDPAVHGEGVEAEPGEEIWVWTPAPPEVK